MMVSNSRITRRSLLRASAMATLGVAATGLVAACGKGNGQAESEDLIIASAGGSLQDSIQDALVTPYTKDSTASIKFLSGTADQVVTRVLTATNSRVLDLAWMQPQSLSRLTAAKAILPLDKSIVKTLSDVPDAFRSDDWVGIYATYLGLAYNREKIPEGITSYLDLWNPKYKGKVALPTFDWQGFKFLQIVNHILGGSQSDLTRGVNKIKEFYQTQNPVPMSGSDQGVQQLASGQVWAALFYDARARQLQASGKPIEFVYPKEGALGEGQGPCVAKLAHADSAMKFIEFALQPASQIALSKAVGYAPTSSKALASMPDDMKNLVPPNDAIDNLLKLDYAPAYDQISHWQTVWNSEVLG